MSPGVAPLLPANATPAEAKAAILRDGFAVLPNVLDEELREKLLGHVKRYIDSGERTRVLVQDFHGRKTFRFFDLLNADPEWQLLPIHGKILAIVKAVLGEDLQLGTLGTVSIGPGEKAQVIHADDGLYNLRRPHPNIYLNVIVSLSEFTPANGATHVVPQSNHFDHYPDPTKPHASIQAAMPAGSALFVLGTTFHGGGANKTTDEIRHGITMAYVSHWVRPQESFLLSVSQERAAAFPRQLQELMGYKIGKKRLGRIYAGKEHKFTGPLSKLVALDWESDGDTDSQYRPKEGNPAEVKAKI